MKKVRAIIFLIFSLLAGTYQVSAAEKTELLKIDWSFNGLFGKFDRGSLQRGYQVYSEVCAACHSMKYLSYRNLSEKGGPEFSIEQAKAIAASFEITDGPNADGEMFTRPGKLSDKFLMPYENDKAAQAANGGAYPPDLSLITKARAGGADYLYSLLVGYGEAPKNIDVKEDLYYNSAYYGNWIAMPQPLYVDSVSYSDGHEASIEQMAADVTEFLSWTAEPEMEVRKRTGIATVSFLLIMVILSYFAKVQIWSNIKKNNTT